MEDFTLFSSETALILVDLQHGIVSLSTKPHSSDVVVSNATALAKAFREQGALVILVRVANLPDGRDQLLPPTDVATKVAQRPQGWAELVEDLHVADSDVVITKRQWGAFYGTELDLQLRRRRIRTLVMGGIATHIGVESTAREAYERGYGQVFVEDAMSSTAEESHSHSFKAVFPRIGRVRSTAQVLGALKRSAT